MKLLVVLAVSIALCDGNAIPLVPRDNSHYVEGESHYIWMPDGEGVPHLVDLHKPPEEDILSATRNGANNAYWLFTRQNAYNAQILVQNNGHSVSSSNYVGSRPLKVIVHGWNSNGNSEINILLVGAFLDDSDCNVIVVDWRSAANDLYTTAVGAVPSVGQFLGNFLSWLISNHGGNWNNVHLVGFSLGAHVVGNAGRTAGRQARRITGLDPSGPLWGGNNNTLNANDGQYVEVIHTDGGILGINNPIGRTNFYPNGGRNAQPGCFESTCSHSRVYWFFAATIWHHHLIGRQCTDLNQANSNQCTGGNLPMGNADLIKNGNGLFALTTLSSWPF